MNILTIQDKIQKGRLRKAKADRTIKQAKFHRQLAQDYSARVNLLNRKLNPTPMEKGLESYALSMVVYHKQLSNKLSAEANNA